MEGFPKLGHINIQFVKCMIKNQCPSVGGLYSTLLQAISVESFVAKKKEEFKKTFETCTYLRSC